MTEQETQIRAAMMTAREERWQGLRDVVSRGVEAVARGDASSAVFSLIWANIEKSLSEAEARAESAESELRELRDRIKGIAGTLDTQTAYAGRSEREQLLELARRCRETAKTLRSLTSSEEQDG